MRKIFLLPLIAAASIAITLYSCQKEADDKIPGSGTISSDNPAQLSAALKVWHGKRTTGNPPAATGNIPQLDPTVNLEVRAFAGRYAIIKPEVLNGEVAGYYLSIAGAGQYFNIDFSTPRNIPGRGIRRNGLLRPQTGNADSSIVIVLPSTIQVPDTFCVTYWPYSPTGQVGQPVTTCIIVSALGTDPSNGWIQNDFRFTATWEVYNGQRENIDTIVHNKWWHYNGDYSCYYDSTSGTSMLYWWNGTGPILVSDSIYYRKANLRFATNGAMDYREDSDEKMINTGLSTCSNFVFETDNWSDTLVGGWSYNSTTHKMILIFEFDYYGVPEPEAYEYDVIKVNDNHFILKDIDDYYIRFER